MQQLVHVPSYNTLMQISKAAQCRAPRKHVLLLLRAANDMATSAIHPFDYNYEYSSAALSKHQPATQATKA